MYVCAVYASLLITSWLLLSHHQDVYVCVEHCHMLFLRMTHVLCKGICLLCHGTCFYVSSGITVCWTVSLT